MKKFLFLALILSSLVLSSCSSKDDDSSEEYPKTVNIKFDITTSRNSAAIINRTLDNDTQIENVENLPYSFTYAQEEVNEGTYLKLTYIDNANYQADSNGNTSWTDYEAELKISIGNDVVKSETFNVVEGSGTVQVDYTVE